MPAFRLVLPLPGEASWGGGGWRLSGWRPALASTVAGTPRAFVAVNNGPTGLPGVSPWGPRGRHADPGVAAARGCPALRPPGDPGSGIPSTSVQVSARLARRPHLWVSGQTGSAVASLECRLFLSEGTLVLLSPPASWPPPPPCLSSLPAHGQRRAPVETAGQRLAWAPHTHSKQTPVCCRCSESPGRGLRFALPRFWKPDVRPQGVSRAGSFRAWGRLSVTPPGFSCLRGSCWQPSRTRHPDLCPIFTWPSPRPNPSFQGHRARHQGQPSLPLPSFTAVSAETPPPDRVPF